MNSCFSLLSVVSTDIIQMQHGTYMVKRRATGRLRVSAREGALSIYGICIIYLSHLLQRIMPTLAYTSIKKAVYLPCCLHWNYVSAIERMSGTA